MTNFTQWLLFQPLKRKILWVIMVIVITTITTISSFLYWQKYQQQRQDFIRNNLALARLVAEYTVLPLVFDDKKGAEEQLSKLWQDPRIIFVRLEKANGEILVDYDPFNYAPNAPLDAKQEWFWQGNQLYFAVRVSYEHENLGLLKGAFRLDELIQAQRQEQLFILAVILIAVICSYGMALISRRFVMTSINQLECHARRIAEQPDIYESIVYPAHRKDEVGHLYEAFNLLMERIQKKEAEILQFNSDLEVKIEERTQELQAAMQSKSMFLANMSHEIRTPMNAIIGMTHLALQTDLTKKQRNYLDKINISAKWLLGILNDILDFSKLEAGKLKLEHAEFRLETVIQHLTDISVPLLNGKQLTLSFEVDPEVPNALIGDSLRLGQVLLNLLSNAIKFTETGTVKVCVQLLSSDAAQACLRFSVIDSGIGLSEEQQSRLFSAFNQADNSTTRKYGGTGLGLVISKDLVEAMDGTIGIESCLGVGSTFYFIATFALAADSTANPLPLQTFMQNNYSAWDNLYVLLVEDNFINQELVLEILRKEGIRVDLANNGAEAIEMVGRNNYSAVLMDCQMPVMDGFEATRIIRADPRFADLPIIAMTANVMVEDRERCLDSGMNDHFGKPIDWDRFFQTLARWTKPTDYQPTLPTSNLSQENGNACSDLANKQLEPSFAASLPDDTLTLQQLMVKLNVALANDYFVYDELLEQLKMLLPDNKQAEYDILQQHIFDTDYPKAQLVLNSLIGGPKEKIEIANQDQDQDQRSIVLIVDDTRNNQEVLASLLDQDYQVKVAGNGQRALDIARCFPHPDLILLDLNMPKMDGYEVFRKLHEKPLTSYIPVIFVTASSDLESETRGLQLGAVDYITKPISPPIVLQRVRNQVLIKQHEKDLKRIAHYDALTRIPNRVLLADRMKQAIAQTKRARKTLGVCYLDLDGFKPVNDTLGHHAGDQVLIEIARRIGSILREGDTVARLGGDEFVVLLPDLNHIEECIVTLKRLLEIIAQPILLQNQSFSLTTSIGVSIFPSDDNDPDVLLRHADQAMYIAKQSGKNRYHLYNSTHDRKNRLYHESILRIQSGLDNHEFVLYYQPKVDLISRQVVCAEALVRWNHPERGLLLPVEFLNDVRNSELEIRLGEWVIETALSQLVQWDKEGYAIDVSVNITACHLQSEGFVDHLKHIFSCYPILLANRLHIEVLETTALEDSSTVSATMEACRAMGVRFALDDFGTGYSSLTYLHRLPLDTLKIDQSFVRDMLIDKGDNAIVQGVIALAKAFGLKTVAEGIETMEHFDALRDMGCEFGQGYAIARPMSAPDFGITTARLFT